LEISPLRRRHALETIEVEVRDLDGRAVVAVADRVRGARHVLAHAERGARTADERRLAAPELAGDRDDVADLEARGELGRECLCLLRGARLHGGSVFSPHACVSHRRDRHHRSGAVRAVQGRLPGRDRRVRRPLPGPRRRDGRPRGRLEPDAPRARRVSRPRDGEAVLRVGRVPRRDQAPRGRREPEDGRRRGRELEEPELLGRRRGRDEGELRLRRRERPEASAEQLGQLREVGLEHLQHRRRVERGGRVVERVELDRAPADRRLLLLPVHLRDAERPAGEKLRREVAERRDDDGLDQLDLAEEMALAGLDLVRLRVAVARRAALEDVRDVDVCACEADLCEQLLEQLAGLADERQALLVLVETGRLADEHQVGVRIAGAEDDLRPPLCEAAAGAAGNGFPVRMKPVELLDRNGAHGPEDYAYRRMEMTRAFQAPRGASTTISSPSERPRTARPTGDSGETPPTLEISTVMRSPSSRSSSTVAPTVTTPLAAAAASSITSACWSRARRIAIRRSRRPCSFFAAWYSKFSERSPWARAVAIASMIAFRLGPSSSSSSACSCACAAGVRTSPSSATG